MEKLLEGDELEQKCKELNIDTQGERIFQSSSGRFPRASDYELQLRLAEYQRSLRESRLWILALVSSITAIISAATAIITVLMKLD